MAQSSVTLYGVVDSGLQYRNKSADNAGSLTESRSGGISPSIWGIKGVEDLGSGLKASFNLQGHFSSDTGELTSGPGFGSQIFRREANVGLTGNWGTITLGRQYSPALIGVIGTEARGFKEQFSNLYVWAYNQLSSPGNALGAGTNTGNDVGVFIGNAVQYSNSFGPVWLAAAYSFGEVSGSMNKGDEISLGASYTGPATVALGYQAMKDGTSGATVSRLWTAGVAVPFGGAFNGRLNYVDVINNATGGGRISHVQSSGAGIDYSWNGNNTTTLAGYYSRYRSDAHNSSTRSVVLSNDHSFSKRTTLYAQLAYVDAGPVGTADSLESLKTSIVAGGTAPGAKTLLVGAGLKHTF
ncbi:porin [Cupriavidus sp. WKF15]|uniref:porin n=1 Tax=Cupriavidus sp. WKF15 TaxID=3032282 RepID=UPI0023E17693|nr:porin [Cupriavidus sp. WKF15]WER50942.1 porin [Cupriavidus sp. WKF15]